MKINVLTAEESEAVKWLIQWTREQVDEILEGARTMSRNGECDSKYGTRVERIVNTLKELEKKL